MLSLVRNLISGGSFPENEFSCISKDISSGQFLNKYGESLPESEFSDIPKSLILVRFANDGGKLPVSLFLDS